MTAVSTAIDDAVPAPARSVAAALRRQRGWQRRRSWPVLTVFACMVSVQLLVAVISIDLMSAVRAYVTGESLYSKGQKDAHIHLVDYTEHLRDADYQRFVRALAFPIGDRMAREALQKTPPDLDAARRGLLAGGTPADEIPGVIRLFRWFHETPLMADAIVTWTEGDRLIDSVRQLGKDFHNRIAAGDVSSAPRVREQAQALNQSLTELEVRFAAQLAAGARLSQHLLLALNLGLALLLGVSGLAFVRHSSRIQAATEDEVRQRQQSLQRLLDSAAEGLYGVDMAGRCTFINRAALQMLGYETQQQLLGRDMHALIHHSNADGSRQPSERSRITQSYRAQHDMHATDEVFWRRDGSSFPVEYWSHPMMDDQLHGAVVTFFDISERLRMQAALRQGEIRMAGLVDAVNDGLVTIDSGERIVLFNRAAERLFGVPSREAIGSPVERFIPRQPDQLRGERIQQLLANDAEAHCHGAVHELTGRRADGHEFALEASLSRLDAEHGPLVTFVLRDGTHLQMARAERQAREALEASSRAKTAFLSRMSHELRTPLNAVLGFSQLLRLDANHRLSLTQLERVQRIENAGAHLLALVNDVLDLSRVESGDLTVTLDSVDIHGAAEDALSMVLPLASAVGVDVRIDDQDSQPGGAAGLAVLADRVRLRQVLVNLLSNAVKYNRAGGQVRVRWQQRGEHCAVSIADNGLGMTPEQLQQLFEPFNRLGAENSKIEGTGIGLVLSRRLAESMRGELHLESSSQGTVAWLTLAISGQAPQPSDQLAPPSQHGNLDDGLRVLYAEDNEVNVELVRHIAALRPSVALDIAECGSVALLKARRDPPDMMLVDMNLGDMTGIELARALRAETATAHIRLVALSADALPEQISAALAASFEDYLTKPIDFRELLDVFDGRRSRMPKLT